MKWIIPILIIIMLATVTIADEGEIEIYKPREVLDLSIHLTNTTGDVIGAVCRVEIRNESYGVILDTTLNEIDGGWYNGTYNQSRVGKYFCRQNCTKGKLFTADTCDFVIEGDAQMPIAVILTVIFVIVFYFFIMIKLFTSRDFTEHGLITLLFLMIAFWILLLPLNMAVQYNNDGGGPVAVTDYLNLLYKIMVYLNWFITFYFFLWFIVQMVKKVALLKGGQRRIE